MTLEEGRQLLAREGLPFIELRFETERDFFSAVCPWAVTAAGRKAPVTVLRAEAPNGRRHLELQFMEDRLVDLFFGGFSFELWEESDPEKALLESIRLVTGGQSWVSITVNAKTNRWMGDGWFPVNDGSGTLRQALSKLECPRAWWKRLPGSRRIYEVYDWNEYHRIER